MNQIPVNDQTTHPSNPVTFYRSLDYSPDVADAVEATFKPRETADRDLHFGIDEREYVFIAFAEGQYAIAEVLRDDADDISLDVSLDESEMVRLNDALVAQIARVARGEVVS